MLAELETLIESAVSREKYAVAKLISLFEKSDEHSLKRRSLVCEKLKVNKRGKVIGWTGSPGVGKSTLLGKLIQEFLNSNKEKSVAILAIDPSSTKSGGSILGDRTRVVLPYAENRIFFRSQAAGKTLGGVASNTFAVVQLLELIFDIVIIETVGVGQNEIEISQLSDLVFYLLQPDSGDQIQFLKAGIMEIPQYFIINKSDKKKEVKKCFYQLSTTLEFLFQFNNQKKPDVLLCSALNLEGLNDLILVINDNIQTKDEFLIDRRVHYFKEFINDKVGSMGSNFLEEQHFAFDQKISFEDNILQAAKLIEKKFNQEIL
jgi:LAO/AO transport system ATPase